MFLCALAPRPRRVSEHGTWHFHLPFTGRTRSAVMAAQMMRLLCKGGVTGMQTALAMKYTDVYCVLLCNNYA